VVLCAAPQGGASGLRRARAHTLGAKDCKPEIDTSEIIVDFQLHFTTDFQWHLSTCFNGFDV
jgi:hypothetical protein